MPESSAAAFTVAFVVGVTPGKWARVWSERMPGHPLTLRPVAQAEALSALAEGGADVALLRLPVADDALSVIPLYAEQAVVVASKGHALEAVDSVTLAELGEFEVLEISENGDDWGRVVELVAANVGVAVMPQSVARALSRRDVTARPVTDAPETRIALVWPADRTTPEVEEFVGIVRGRTANSSRGTAEPAADTTATAKPGRGSSAPRDAGRGGKTGKSKTRPKPQGKPKRRQGR